MTKRKRTTTLTMIRNLSDRLTGSESTEGEPAAEAPATRSAARGEPEIVAAALATRKVRARRQA